MLKKHLDSDGGLKGRVSKQKVEEAHRTWVDEESEKLLKLDLKKRVMVDRENAKKKMSKEGMKAIEKVKIPGVNDAKTGNRPSRKAGRNQIDKIIEASIAKSNKSREGKEIYRKVAAPRRDKKIKKSPTALKISREKKAPKVLPRRLSQPDPVMKNEDFENSVPASVHFDLHGRRMNENKGGVGGLESGGGWFGGWWHAWCIRVYGDRCLTQHLFTFHFKHLFCLNNDYFIFKII